MNSQSKIIIVLLAIILLATIILVLKTTGVIKPAPKDFSVLETKSENIMSESKVMNVLLQRLLFTILYIKTMGIFILAITSAISIALSIGMYKLYQKLSVSGMAVLLSLSMPIILCLTMFLHPVISGILGAIVGIASFITFMHYFEALDMSKYILFVLFIPVIGWIIVVVQYIRSNIRLAEMFDKGIGFKIGLILLPSIFQPILGYQK